MWTTNPIGNSVSKWNVANGTRVSYAVTSVQAVTFNTVTKEAWIGRNAAVAFISSGGTVTCCANGVYTMKMEFDGTYVWVIQNGVFSKLNSTGGIIRNYYPPNNAAFASHYDSNTGFMWIATNGTNALYRMGTT